MVVGKLCRMNFTIESVHERRHDSVLCDEYMIFCNNILGKPMDSSKLYEYRMRDKLAYVPRYPN